MGLSISWIVGEKGRGIILEVKDPCLCDVRMASRRLFVDGIVDGIDGFRTLIIWNRRRPVRECRGETISRSHISIRSNMPDVAGQVDLVIELSRRRGTAVMLRFCLRSRRI